MQDVCKISFKIKNNINIRNIFMCKRREVKVK